VASESAIRHDVRVGDGELLIRRNQKLLAEAAKRAFPDLPRTIPDPLDLIPCSWSALQGMDKQEQGF
jgi:hypothetical protein